jgi:hypothetical protein
VYSGSGAIESHQVSFQTGPLEPHVVLNEVLANPLGPEPEQEWVELFNDGLGTVSLDAWTLEDVGGQTALPSFALSPGQFALIVPVGYDKTSTVDIPPAPNVPLLFVEKLGTNGLANAGEPLLLRAPDGQVVSTFPAVPKPKAGVSVARRVPGALDWEPEAFARHADPGASPGAANQL